jgi:hypothetical protein
MYFTDFNDFIIEASVTILKVIVFWDVALCSPVETDRRFRGAYCFHHQGNRPVAW